MPKPRKKVNEKGNYRLISLTSVIKKVMEKIVCNRLIHLSESGNLLSPFQAGFRPRSTKDQLLRLLQSIADSFQQNPMQKTVMTLIDFSKAYDGVWRNSLLLKMARISTQMVRWIQEWLSNRFNWVTYEGEQSKKKAFKQGAPQGSELSPLLILFFIDAIAEELERVEKKKFADDEAIWTQHSNLKEAEKMVQISLRKLEKWAKE